MKIITGYHLRLSGGNVLPDLADDAVFNQNILLLPVKWGRWCDYLYAFE
jgi:hypothetical protein